MAKRLEKDEWLVLILNRESFMSVFAHGQMPESLALSTSFKCNSKEEAKRFVESYLERTPNLHKRRIAIVRVEAVGQVLASIEWDC